MASSEHDRSAIARWVLLALGLIAILSAAFFYPSFHKPVPRRPHSGIGSPVKADPPEPAPLTFQKDIAPEDAAAINAARPEYSGSIVIARPFVAEHGPSRQADLARATDCLTQAIYYEAASESTQGQRAVAQVVLNRVRDPRFPGSVCGVVFQGSDRRTGCQFTFTCDGALARVPVAAVYTRARTIAVAALAGRVEPAVGLATHYHTNQVVPVWRTDLIKLRTIGAHIFYGWQGREKSARGLRAVYAGVEPIIVPGLPHESPVEIDALASGGDFGGSNPFAPAPPTSPLTAPKIAEPELGVMRADEHAGTLDAGNSGTLQADNQAGTLARP